MLAVRINLTLLLAWPITNNGVEAAARLCRGALPQVLGGSWIVISGLSRPVIWVISIVILQIITYL